MVICAGLLPAPFPGLRLNSPYLLFHSTTFCSSRPLSLTEAFSFFMACLKSSIVTARSGAFTSALFGGIGSPVVAVLTPVMC
jgi:hypothetical protein